MRPPDHEIDVSDSRHVHARPIAITTRVSRMQHTGGYKFEFTLLFFPNIELRCYSQAILAWLEDVLLPPSNALKTCAFCLPLLAQPSQFTQIYKQNLKLQQKIFLVYMACLLHNRCQCNFLIYKKSESNMEMMWYYCMKISIKFFTE